MADLAVAQRALVPTTTGVEVYSLLVVFHLAGQEFGLLADAVREIIRRRATTRVPHASPYIDGVINLRGRIIPVFNLRRRLGLPPAAADDASASQAVIVVEYDGNDAGLLVDKVSDVVKIAGSDVDASACRVEAARQTHFLEGTVKLQGRLVTLLRLEPLLEE
jgi:purine-binding chemotaxis protein CheW